MKHYETGIRKIAERATGKTIPPFAHVHHINFDRLDNLPGNLAVINRLDHMRMHFAIRTLLKRLIVGVSCKDAYARGYIEFDPIARAYMIGDPAFVMVKLKDL